MPSNRKPPGDDEAIAHQKVMDAIAQSKKASSADTDKEASATLKPSISLIRLREGGLRRLDAVAADDRRRFFASVLLALAINVGLLTALAIFGRVRIWAPNTPAQSISIVFIEEAVEPIFPELRDPEIVPEPEPEPEVPEPIDDPELVDEPEPEPLPEPEEAPPAPEPEPEPEETFEPEEAEPVLDLSPREPEFAPPSDEPPAPLIPESALDALVPGDLTAAEETAADAGDQAEVDRLAEEEQSVAEDSDALTEDQDREAGLEVDDSDAEEDGEMSVGDEDARLSSAPEEIGDDEQQITGDDQFDNDEAYDFSSRFITPRQAIPLPSVDLPVGETAAIPGQSGVVAIFCPDEFTNEDKQQECAGRTEIRSGWRPGASGENWDEATRLLRQERRGGGVGNAPATVLPPSVARAQEDIQRSRDLTDFRRSQDDINNLPQTSDNIVNTLGRPNIGPESVEPSWSQREDPIFDQSDIDDLEEALEEAEKNKQ